MSNLSTLIKIISAQKTKDVWLIQSNCMFFVLFWQEGVHSSFAGFAYLLMCKSPFTALYITNPEKILSFRGTKPRY
jgi:hypothetical protein